MAVFSNIKKPAPKWFRIFNRIYGPTETFVMALMLILGYGSESQTMLIIKLTSSFLRTVLEAVLVEEQTQTDNGTN